MGSCVSTFHKNGKLDIPLSPVKERQPYGDRPANGWSAANFRDLGSKEETFFDSRPWLDSDCEDDFFSVNGDFTPSCGNTPVHQSFPGTPRVNTTSLQDRTPGSIPEPSPTGKKMKLAELFRQTSRKCSEDQRADEQCTQGSQNTASEKMGVKTTILDVLPSTNGTPYVSGTHSVCSSAWTANEDSAVEKPIKPMQCCLPSLVSCHNFSERKKKMSPSIAVNA